MTPCEEIVRSLFVAIGSGVPEEVSRVLGDEFVFELPFIAHIRTPMNKAEYLRFVTRVFERHETFALALRASYPSGDDTLVAEYDSYAPLRSRGVVYTNEYIAVFKVAGRRVVFWREYANPTRTGLVRSAGEPETLSPTAPRLE